MHRRIICVGPTQPIIDKDLAEQRFEPVALSWDADTLTTIPQAFVAFWVYVSTLYVFQLFQGSVAFSEETGDRIAWTKIEQLQNKKYEVVAFYDQKSDNLTW